MTPKSLLRRRECVSVADEFTSGSFQTVLDDPAQPKRVDNLLICSGKVYYDLAAEREARGDDKTAIVRVEQLYPRPDIRLSETLEPYKSAQRVAWVQEESRNRGGWRFVDNWLADMTERPRVDYVGRAASASPAAGSHKEHNDQLRKILDEAFNRE